MVPIVLDLLYCLALLLATASGLWFAVFRPKYRRHLLERFGGAPRARRGRGPAVWIHGVSVGEVRAIEPLIAGWLAAQPGVPFVVSATTRTGRAVARRAFQRWPTFQFPWDFSFAVLFALRRARPRAVVLMELEVWPNFLRACESLRIPVFIANGRITPRSADGWARLAWIGRPMFASLAGVAAQTPDDAARFVRLGVPEVRVRVVGSVKYDGVALARPTAAATRALQQAYGVAPDELVFVAGSTHPPEHEAVVGAWRAAQAAGKLQTAGGTPASGVRLVIVPRHPERYAEVFAFLEREGIEYHRRSRGPLPADGPRVVVGDTMGELAGLYALADLAFVGGSLVAHGGQNMLEPAGLGVATLFGPHTHNFTAVAGDLLAREGARRVQDAGGLSAAVVALLGDGSARVRLGERGRAAVQAGRGATARTVAFFLTELERRAATGRAGRPVLGA